MGIRDRLRRREKTPEEQEVERKKRELKEAEDRVKEEKRRKKEQDKLDRIKKDAANPPAVPPAVPVAGAVDAGAKTLEEFPVGQKIGWEVTRLVEGQTKRITVVKGAVAIKADRFGRPPKFMFVEVKRDGRTNSYFIDPQRLLMVVTTQGRKKTQVVSHKVVFHEFISEPMKADGTIEWSDELEVLLADAGLDQYVQIASSDLGFQLTPTLKKVMVIVGVLGIFIGLALNGAYHFIPQTVISWVP